MSCCWSLSARKTKLRSSAWWWGPFERGGSLLSRYRSRWGAWLQRCQQSKVLSFSNILDVFRCLHYHHQQQPIERFPTSSSSTFSTWKEPAMSWMSCLTLSSISTHPKETWKNRSVLNRAANIPHSPSSLETARLWGNHWPDAVLQIRSFLLFTTRIPL